MSFKGAFNMVSSARVSGRGLRFYSFTLKNTDWFGSETIDCVLSDANMLSPWYYRKLNIKAGKEMRFDFDTVNWTWCQGDFFAILGKKDKIIKRWSLQLRSYASGECPECHGTRKCKHCRGEGYSVDLKITGDITACPYCGGTGVCQRCYIPTRETPLSIASHIGLDGQGQGRKDGMFRRYRPVEQIRMDIAELQRKIDQTDWDIKMMQLRGTQTDGASPYRSYLQLRHSYRRQLIELQQELQNAI